MTKLLSKTIGCIIAMAFLLACGNKSDKSNETNSATPVFNVHTYKVVGLNDSLVIDSVWKLMFSFDGIEELVMNKNDSVVSLKVDSNIVNIKDLEQEIENRGAEIIEKVF